MDKAVTKKIKESILAGDFKTAQDVLITVTRDDQADLLLFFAWETESIVFYAFVIHRLFFEQNAFWHAVASQMLLVPLSFINGATVLGLYHIKMAIHLEPLNIEHKEYMLSFYDLPEPLLSKEVAITVAKDVLKNNPTSEKALDILSRLQD